MRYVLDHLLMRSQLDLSSKITHYEKILRKRDISVGMKKRIEKDVDNYQKQLKDVQQAIKVLKAATGILPVINMAELRVFRERSKYTLRQVQDITGISNAYLSQLETGKIKNPSYSVIQKLLNLYNPINGDENNS